jgi:hypothetical protein
MVTATMSPPTTIPDPSRYSGLDLGQLGEAHTQIVKVQTRDLLVKVLGQHLDLVLVVARFGPHFDLGHGLVGE